MENQGILLDTGTNEVEILELVIGGQCFGINVLKIRQLVEYESQNITPIHHPGIHSAIMGTMLFHGTPITVIDLCRYLNLQEKDRTDTPQVIAVCEFNNTIHGFRVDGFDKIHRISWNDIQVISLGDDFLLAVTGVFSTKEWDIMILDFEGIISDIIGPIHSSRGAEHSELTQDAGKAQQRRNTNILVVDDSRIVRKQIEQLLTEADYSNVVACSNGEEAYETIRSLGNKASNESKQIGEFLDVVVTDIEMPRMDGLTLCKKIKEEIPDLSVLILSSMISEQMALKCQQVSADGYLSKMESEKLIDLLDELCLP